MADPESVKLSDVDEEHIPVSSAEGGVALHGADNRWIRPSTPEDGPAIVALMRSAGLQPHSDPEQLHWKYWQERADYPGPRSFVLTDGHDLLAHVAVVPGALRRGETRASVIHMIDWAARREAAGAGVRLSKHVQRTSDFVLAIGGSHQTLKILPLMGYTHCGNVSGYVRTLSPLGIVSRPIPSRWKLVPRMARSLLWSLMAPRGDTAGWRMHRVGPDEIERVCAARATSGRPETGAFERSPALFRHALTCPIVPIELYGLEKAGRIGGYFLLSYAPGQARIVDLWTASGEPSDWRALIHAAVSQARSKRGLAELVAWSNDPGLSQALKDCGFHERLSLPIYVRASAKEAIPHDIMRVQMLDSDAFYLHLDGDELWA
jgi:hypothetical protein